VRCISSLIISSTVTRALGDNINQVLNDNWEAVFEDLEGAYTELVNKITLNVFNGFTSKVSIEEAFD
jgi:hypothetical protein